MQASSGALPSQAQAGLKETQKQQGYFLACVCVPYQNLTVKQSAQERVPVSISRLELLSPNVMRVGLKATIRFDNQAGQFITLLHPENAVARSYSIASLPLEDHIDLHVRRIAGGVMSSWLFERATVGQPLAIEGPKGACFYVAGKPEQPVILAGTGTGLAPLYGIARDALLQGHTGPVKLFHGAVTEDGLYLRNELCLLAVRFPNFEYRPVVLQGTVPEGGETGSLDSCALRRYPNLDGWRAYVCGDAQFVNTFKKKVFLAGVASREIYSDSFVPAAP